jgi:hypothetical protein
MYWKRYSAEDCLKILQQVELDWAFEECPCSGMMSTLEAVNTMTEFSSNGVVLRQGDVLLERLNGRSGTHWLIAVGQKLGGSSKATTVHAGIYAGGGYVSQSHGAGLTTDRLDGTERWKVYRYEPRPDIAELAADVAQNLVQRTANDRGFGTYNKGRSLKSAFAPKRNGVIAANDISNFLNKIDQPGTLYARTFFCSNFSVLCYSLASEFLTSHCHYAIGLDFERASPGEMAEFFESGDGKRRGWRRVGEIIG